MRFSVIIPVYNAEKHIKNSIQSIINQTFQDFEIILVNDGSTDQSGILCDKFANVYSGMIRVLHQENKGPLLTRCNGINAARGEYCIFLDSDDMIEENGLEIIEKTIQQYELPDMIIYSFYYEQLTGEKRKAVPLFQYDTVMEGEEQKRELYEKFFTSTGLNNVWTKAVKRTVFNGTYPDYNQYAKLRCSEDRLHSMGMVTNAERIVYVDKPIYRYKILPNSISRTFTVDTLSRFNTRIMYNEELNYLVKWGMSSCDWKERLNANWVLQTWHVFEMYYCKSSNALMKNQVLKYNWNEYLPDEILENIENNPFLNKQQRKCCRWLIQKNYHRLRYYLLKKNIRANIRRLK